MNNFAVILRHRGAPFLFGGLIALIAVGAGEFFARMQFGDRNLAGQIGTFFGAIWVIALAPQVLLNCRSLGAGVVWLGAAMLGVVATTLIAPAQFFLYVGATLIAGAAAGWFYALGKFAGLLNEKLRRPAAAFVSVIFLLSPWWSGAILASGEDWLKIFAVWLSPLAILAAALPDLNFSTLPGLYHIWMGSTCPTPHSVIVAVAAYLAPAILIGAATVILKPENKIEN